jgi:hypothetical protein
MPVGFKNSPFVKQVSSIAEPIYNYGVRPIYNLSSGAINLANKLGGSMFGYDGSQITPYASKKDFTPQSGEQFYPFNLFVPNTTANAQQQNNQMQLDPNMFYQDSILRTQELTPPSNKEIKQKKVETETTSTTGQDRPTYPATGYTYPSVDPLTKRVEEPAKSTEDLKKLNLFDKLANFSNTPFIRDMAMKALEESGPRTGVPQNLGQIISKGYQYAREQDNVRKDLAQKALNSGLNEQSFLYTVTDPRTDKTYNVAWDKKLGGAVVNINGSKVPYTPDMFGEGTTAQISTAGNLAKSDLTSSQFIKLRDSINQDENSLRKMSELIQDADSLDQGLEKLGVGFSTYIKTIMNQNDLTWEELRQKTIAGDFQALIGSNRLDIMGPGVLTEQDAERIIRALGGDPTALDWNKEVFNDQLSKVFRDKYDSYKNNIELYNIETEGAFSKFKPKDLIEFNDIFKDILNVNIALDIGLEDVSTLNLQQLRKIDLSRFAGNPEMINALTQRMTQLLQEQ